MATKLTSLQGQSYHLAYSSGIAHASICGLKFKLPNVMGAPQGSNESFISGIIAHQVLEASSKILLEIWNSSRNMTDLLDSWEPHFQKIKDNMKWEEYRVQNINHHLELAKSRLTGLAEVLATKMHKDIPPNRIISEVSIINTFRKHEGRIDAIFEYNDHNETVEWKTYADKGISDYDRYQTISNGMLVNYRYNKEEDDFSGNVLTVVTPSKIHHPQPTPKKISVIKEARSYILSVLSGVTLQTKLPYFAVCQHCSYLNPCKFYMSDKADTEDKILLWKRRFRVLKKRESTHINKFLVDRLNMDQLKELRIADCNYNFKQIVETGGICTITLEKNPANEDVNHRLYKGDNVRITGVEPKVPLLACLSCIGTIRSIVGNVLSIDVYLGNVEQLKELPIVLIKTEVDLTKRELESIDSIHRNAGRLQRLAYGLIGR